MLNYRLLDLKGKELPQNEIMWKKVYKYIHMWNCDEEWLC